MKPILVANANLVTMFLASPNTVLIMVANQVTDFPEGELDKVALFALCYYGVC